LNGFECEVYMFGETKTIDVYTNHTLEELKQDWDLREKLIIKEIIKQIEIQSYIKQI